MAMVLPRDANPYLPPSKRKGVYAAVRREAARAWRQWLAEHPPPAEPEWTGDTPTGWIELYREWAESARLMGAR